MNKTLKIGLIVSTVAVAATSIAVPLALLNKSNNDNKDQHQYTELNLTTAEGLQIKSSAKTLAASILGLTKTTGSISSIAKVSRYKDMIKIEGDLGGKAFECNIEFKKDDLANSIIHSFILDKKTLPISKNTIDASTLDTSIKAFERAQVANGLQKQIKDEIEAMAKVATATSASATTAPDAATKITDLASFESITGLTVPRKEGTTIVFKSVTGANGKVNVIFTVTVDGATTRSIDTQTISIIGFLNPKDTIQTQAKATVEAIPKVATHSRAKWISAERVSKEISSLADFESKTGLTVPKPTGAIITLKSVTGFENTLSAIFTVTVPGATVESIDTEAIGITGWLNWGDDLLSILIVKLEDMPKVAIASSASSILPTEAAKRITDIVSFESITGLQVYRDPRATITLKSVQASGDVVNVVFTMAVVGSTWGQTNTNPIAFGGWKTS